MIRKLIESEIFKGVIVISIFFFPEGKILSEELNDGLCISESIFVNFVNLFQCICQCLFSKLYCPLVIIHDFGLENRIVQYKAQSNRVASIKAFGKFISLGISLQRSILYRLNFAGISRFSNISVIIANHLIEESFRFISRCDLET